MWRKYLEGLRLRAWIPVLGLGMCLAPSADAQIDDHMRCYKMKDSIKLKGFVDIDIPQFGLAPGCRLGRGKLFCVPADKSGVAVVDRATGSPIDPLLLSAAPSPGDQICYSVRCKDTPDPPATEVTDQFGTRTVTIKRGFLCGPAVKGTAFCGDGVIDLGEECEPTDLGGATCTDLGFASGTLSCAPGCTFDASDCAPTTLPATGQTTVYVTDDDGDIQAGSPLSYVDNGDGTITDLNTQLTWEKKSDDGSLHDQDNVYSWTPGTGSIWEWLGQVNAEGGSGFAGHSDWRIPNAKELQTIIDYERVSPSVDPVFDSSCLAACTVLSCSCTLADLYWSSTTEANDPGAAWGLRFDDGTVETDGKGNDRAVRAVRGVP